MQSKNGRWKGRVDVPIELIRQLSDEAAKGQVPGDGGLARRRNRQPEMTNPEDRKSALFDN
jgi:hypothetical protein